MGEAEAVYKLIPSMTLKKSNVACQWVSIGRKEDRSRRWKQASEKELESGRPLTKLIGHEGLWYEQQDMWSKYLRRPKDSLGDICFAQFAKMYTSSCKVNSFQENSCHDQDKEEAEYEDEIDDGYNTDDIEVEENDDKFNYVMTHRNNYKEGKKLPDYIKLDDPYRGEPHMMRK